MKPYDMFRDNAVKGIQTVAEFLDRYYKGDRYKGRGEEYAAALLASHQADFDTLGVDWISQHDSVTGQVVSFYGPNGFTPPPASMDVVIDRMLDAEANS